MDEVHPRQFIKAAPILQHLAAVDGGEQTVDPPYLDGRCDKAAVGYVSRAYAIFKEVD